jgi:glycosyltransferase involved in cell wall biosynthesis
MHDRMPDLRADMARLTEENTRLAALARQAGLSASLQAYRAAAYHGEARAFRQGLRAVRTSFFWRITAPFRIALDLARGAGPTGSQGAVLLRRFIGLARHQGWRAAWDRVGAYRAHQRRIAAAEARAARALPPVQADAYDAPIDIDPQTVLAPCVLIIAELTLPQCAKYRVWQKQEFFRALGVACTVVDWRETLSCLSEASLATRVILYRVPGFPAQMQMIAALKRMRLHLTWEVDDLIFDRALFLQNRNIDSLDKDMRDGIISGVDLYRNCMLACDAAIASTETLADAMRQSGARDVAVVENALDRETLLLAEAARAASVRHGDGVVIVYGSGTKTHDADFACAAPALLEVMRARGQVRLRVVGELKLAGAFDEFGARVERLPAVPYAAYLGLLAAGDISIAPLEATLFNDAKSNIKFLEAAILGVASVCSPRASFLPVVIDGETGLLAEGDAAWRDTLLRLIDDPALRARLGAASRAAALARYAPDSVARDQVQPLVAAIDRRGAPGLRVLMANVYFWPRSYGGATIVAEAMARRLAARGDTEVFVATCVDRGPHQMALRRYEHGGCQIFAVPVVEDGDAIGQFDNPAVADMFGTILDSVQPDVVHLHSVQWLSATIAQACRARGIPYVITLHDAWWLCPRQFMVTAEGKYCGQTAIDIHVCQACEPGQMHLRLRRDVLLEALHGAALLLSPSEAHRALYLANGISPARVKVAPNGVRWPAPDTKRAPRPVVRFAYVGGDVAVKGFPLVRAAFEAIARPDWELVLVDNTLNLGFGSVATQTWKVRGRIEVVPAYGQDDLDQFFAGIDVLLFPSQWKESFGLTVREALLRQVWVVTTDGGGAAEAVTDGVNGTIIPLDGKPDGLRAAIEAILQDPPWLVADERRSALNETVLSYEDQAASLHATLQAVVEASKHG